jgi:hypothetical protein
VSMCAFKSLKTRPQSGIGHMPFSRDSSSISKLPLLWLVCENFE